MDCADNSVFLTCFVRLNASSVEFLEFQLGFVVLTRLEYARSSCGEYEAWIAQLGEQAPTYHSSDRRCSVATRWYQWPVWFPF